MNIIDDDKRFEIDVSTRDVKHAGEGKVRLIQGDHNSERITFTMDRYVEYHDMSTCSKVEVHYININPSTKEESEDVYTVDDLAVGASDGKIVFSWLVSGSATKYAGSVSFIIKFTNLDENNNITYSWSTGINKEIIIGEGMNCGEGFDEEYSDILAQLEERLEKRLDDYSQPKVLIVSCNADFNDDKTITITNPSASYDDIKWAYEAGKDIVLEVSTGESLYYARLDTHCGYYVWNFPFVGDDEYVGTESGDFMCYILCDPSGQWKGRIAELITTEVLDTITDEIAVDCHAGAKGYYYSHIDLTNRKIYLSAEQVLPQLGEGTQDKTFETPAYDGGNGISLVNNNKYDYLGRCTAIITKVYNNVIEYEGDVGFTKINSVSDFGIDDYTLYVPDQPEIGIADVREGAIATGDRTAATGSFSVATNREGGAHGNYSFTSGRGCRANYCADAGGYKTKANGQQTFTRGSETEADGDNSSAGGKGTKATAPCQFVHGKYNVIDELKKFAHIVGNGSSKTKRSNAYTLDWEGNGCFAGVIEASDLKIANMLLRELITPQMHARIFRGKCLGSVYTEEQQAAVEAGTFDDLFLGDYWEINGVKWRIVDMDYWYGTGHSTETPHHLVIMPDTRIGWNVMNDTYSTEGGYIGSKMYTDILPDIRTTIGEIFGRVWEHEECFVSEVTDGKPTNHEFVTSYADLPNEIMMYGTRIWAYGSDGSGDLALGTYCKTQLALFNVVPYYIQPSRTPNNNTYWLRDTASPGGWAYVDSMGRAGRASAQVKEGIRPVFALY